ncbi:MAG: hypothetical protein HUU35_03620 [Armatimonadetes bacterium]|nr:hypothetical protein [Armatimonadota bacterium]
MAVGEMQKLDIARAEDPLAGAQVEKLTGDEGNAWMPYFNQALFDEQGRLIVHSDRGGDVQLYLLDVEQATMRQLTAEPGGLRRHQSTILPSRGQAAYLAGRKLNLVDLESGRSEPLFEVVEGFEPGILSPTADGSSVTFVTIEALETVIQAGLTTQYANFYEKLYRHPTSVIFRIDTTSGKPDAIWGEREWISHVIVSPTDPNVVVFCHEGPWDRVQRLWRVRADNGECRPLVAHGKLISRTGHEYFNRWGEVVAQYSRRMTPRSKDWLHYNCVVDADGNEERFWRFPSHMPTHIQGSNSDRNLLVGDGCWTSESSTDGRSCLGLIRHGDSERCELTPLCRHDTSWKTQMSHPHPVFSPDDAWIYFNAERDGQNAVYRVRVP